MTDGAQDWSAYWRSRGQGGEAFAGEGVEQHPALTAFWDERFAAAEPDLPVLDLACGAGSALKRADAAGLRRLIGADVSQAALDLMREALPDARAILCQADAVPLADASCGMVVSQFGFEYAGPGAASEMARLTAPAGRVAALVHFAGGAIEREVAEHAASARTIRGTGFVEAATALIEAQFAADTGQPADLPAPRAAFADAARALSDVSKTKPSKLAVHLYGGFRQLYERRKAYELSDIVGWLAGMDGELSAYEGRMAGMRAAAKDEAGMGRIADALTQGGLADAGFAPFTVPGDSAPLAWMLTARRAQ